MEQRTNQITYPDRQKGATEGSSSLCGETEPFAQQENIRQHNTIIHDNEISFSSVALGNLVLKLHNGLVAVDGETTASRRPGTTSSRTAPPQAGPVSTTSSIYINYTRNGQKSSINCNTMNTQYSLVPIYPVWWKRSLQRPSRRIMIIVSMLLISNIVPEKTIDMSHYSMRLRTASRRIPTCDHNEKIHMEIAPAPSLYTSHTPLYYHSFIATLSHYTTDYKKQTFN